MLLYSLGDVETYAKNTYLELKYLLLESKYLSEIRCYARDESTESLYPLGHEASVSICSTEK